VIAAAVSRTGEINAEMGNTTTSFVLPCGGLQYGGRLFLRFDKISLVSLSAYKPLATLHSEISVIPDLRTLSQKTEIGD